jgi:hypothetical protein
VIGHLFSQSAIIDGVFLPVWQASAATGNSASPIVPLLFVKSTSHAQCLPASRESDACGV